MKWVKKTPYYLQNGEYTIAKTGVNGNTRYTLYYLDTPIARFLTADEAKLKHKELNAKSN